MENVFINVENLGSKQFWGIKNWKNEGLVRKKVTREWGFNPKNKNKL